MAKYDSGFDTAKHRFMVQFYDWQNDVLDDVWDLKLVLRS